MPSSSRFNADLVCSLSLGRARGNAAMPVDFFQGPFAVHRSLQRTIRLDAAVVGQKNNLAVIGGHVRMRKQMRPSKSGLLA